MFKIGCDLFQRILNIFLYVNILHFESVLFSVVIVCRNLNPLKDNCVYVGIFLFL